MSDRLLIPLKPEAPSFRAEKFTSTRADQQEPIQPREFARRMETIIQDHRGDSRAITALGCALMSATLMSIGYAEGLEMLAREK